MIKPNRTTGKTLSDIGLDWNVKTETLVTSSGIELPDYAAIIREDTNVPLSIRSNTYHPFQNSELLELLNRVSQQTGLPIQNGGFFGNGEKVFIQMKSNDLKLGTDRVEGYITGINSFDGSTSLAFGNSSVTISCQNTFFASYREVTSKVRHTRYMQTRIDEICRTIEQNVQNEKQMFEDIKKLSEVKIDDKVKDLVTKMLFNVDRKADLQDIEAISKTAQNKIGRFYIDLNGELREKGDNMWGLFSGVTKYTTHSLKKEDSTESKLFGAYGNREREIFHTLVEMV